MIEMKCLAGKQHRVQGEDRTYPCDQVSNTFTAELSVLILLKMIESIDMTPCVISFLVDSCVAEAFDEDLTSRSYSTQ